MGRPRSFDWDEAARLYAECENYTEVGRRLGVTGQTVRCALNPELRDYYSAYQRENRTWVGACIDCGAPATKVFHDAARQGRCKACRTVSQTTTVREGELQCSACRYWLPDEDFPLARAKKQRRGRHALCRPCQSVARQLHRESNRERERASDRKRKRADRDRVKAAA